MTIHTLPLLDPDERFCGLAGDWHGNWRWATYCLDAFGAAGIKSVFQVGDFGIWPGQGGDEYLGKLRVILKEYDMKIYATMGNHEDYDQIDAHEKDDQGIAWFRDNIAVLPRVYAFTHRNRKFLSLGGAPSIDFEYRTHGRDWWPQEMLSETDVDLAIDTAIELGEVDVMLAHDAPDDGTYKVQQIINNNPQGWSKKAINYATDGRMQMNRAVFEIKPKLFIHGHYHVFDYGYLSYGESVPPGQIVSLNPDGTPGNVGIMDVDNIYDLYISTSRTEIDFQEMTRQ